MANNLRYMNTLSGASATWMIEAGIEQKNFLPYQYPTQPFDSRRRRCFGATL